VEDRRDELDFLLHALGELFAFLFGDLGELYSFEPFHDFGFEPGGVEAFEARHVDEEVGDFHFFVDAAFFGEVSDAVFGFDGGFFAQHAELSGVREEDRHDHADGCGFTGSVGADESVDGALGD